MFGSGGVAVFLFNYKFNVDNRHCPYPVPHSLKRRISRGIRLLRRDAHCLGALGSFRSTRALASKRKLFGLLSAVQSWVVAHGGV